MTPEQKQRIEQVTPEELLRRVRQWLIMPSADSVEHTAWPELVAQIDHTLSFVKSQEAGVLLPEWVECQSMFADGAVTPLSEFIRGYEPVDPDAEEWRKEFNAVLNWVATAMRSACIKRLKELAADVEHGDALLSAKAVIRELESLSIEKPKE